MNVKLGMVKGTASIKMHEINPARVKEKLLVVSEFFKDRTFGSTDCLHSFVIMPLARSVVEC